MAFQSLGGQQREYLLHDPSPHPEPEKKEQTREAIKKQLKQLSLSVVIASIFFTIRQEREKGENNKKK